MGEVAQLLVSHDDAWIYGPFSITTLITLITCLIVKYIVLRRIKIYVQTF